MIKFIGAILLATLPAIPASRPKAAELSPLDQFILQAGRPLDATTAAASPGSLFSPAGRLADLTRDLRAAQLNDIVTVVVLDRASAIAEGTTTTARSSSASQSIGAIFGTTKVTGPLANLANLSGDTKVDGKGETTRQTTLTTTLSARVTHVLPNGYLVVEGVKDVQVNSERQQVKVRGVVRPTDLTPSNEVASDRLAMLEIQVNGKGVVGDAIRRPFFLYRLLMNLWPL